MGVVVAEPSETRWSLPLRGRGDLKIGRERDKPSSVISPGCYGVCRVDEHTTESEHYKRLAANLERRQVAEAEVKAAKAERGDLFVVGYRAGFDATPMARTADVTRDTFYRVLQSRDIEPDRQGPAGSTNRRRRGRKRTRGEGDPSEDRPLVGRGLQHHPSVSPADTLLDLKAYHEALPEDRRREGLRGSEQALERSGGVEEVLRELLVLGHPPSQPSSL